MIFSASSFAPPSTIIFGEFSILWGNGAGLESAAVIGRHNRSITLKNDPRLHQLPNIGLSILHVCTD